MILALSLLAAPVWTDPTHAPTEISACVPANEYVRTATTIAVESVSQAILTTEALKDAAEERARADEIERLALWLGVMLGVVTVFAIAGWVI